MIIWEESTKWKGWICINLSQKYKYHQKEYAQLIFGSGFQSAQTGYELKLLALYLRDECGLKPKALREYVIGFCEQHLKDYHFRRYSQIIGAALNHAKKDSVALIQVDNISITDAQVNYINQLNIPYDHKKVLFSIVVMKELDRRCYEQRHGGAYKLGFLSANEDKIHSVKHMAHVPNGLNICGDVLSNLMDTGLVRASYNGYVLEFVEQIPPSETIALQIKDYESAGLYWDLMFDPKRTVTCKTCGVPLRKTNNKQCFCKEHATTFSHKSAQPAKIKQVQCEKCGRAFYIDSRGHRAKYCPSCLRIQGVPGE